jgi:hypothetical protein
MLLSATAEKPVGTSLSMRKQLKIALLFVALFGGGIVRLAPHYDERGQFPEHAEAIHLARSLAFRGEFANPFRLLPTGPSAHSSPAFPAFLALIIRVFGTGAKGNYAFQFAAAAALAVELALLPVLTEAMGWGLCPGLLACAIGLLPPLFTFPDWEASYAGLLIVLVTIFWWTFVSRPQPSWSSAVLLGVTAGILLLTSASAFSVLAVWFIYLLWKSQLGFRKKCWAVVLIPVAMLMPWTVRNYIVFHRVIPFRLALGLELASSYNDCAPVGMRQSEKIGCFGQRSPNHNLEEAQKARALGEAQYNSEKFQEAYRWVVANPGRFSTLTLQRIYAFWFPYETDSPLQQLTIQGRRKERLTIYAMTVLSVLGLPLLMKSNRTASFVVASWLLVFPLIYYLHLFEDRYRYPVLWATLVSGSYPLCLVLRPLLKVLTSHGGEKHMSDTKMSSARFTYRRGCSSKERLFRKTGAKV